MPSAYNSYQGILSVQCTFTISVSYYVRRKSRPWLKAINAFHSS